jgi:hypothetical protein
VVTVVGIEGSVAARIMGPAPVVLALEKESAASAAAMQGRTKDIAAHRAGQAFRSSPLGETPKPPSGAFRSPEAGVNTNHEAREPKSPPVNEAARENHHRIYEPASGSLPNVVPVSPPKVAPAASVVIETAGGMKRWLLPVSVWRLLKWTSRGIKLSPTSARSRLGASLRLENKTTLIVSAGGGEVVLQPGESARITAARADGSLVEVVVTLPKGEI